MTVYEEVRSTVKPDEVKIDEYSVWVVEDIRESGGEWAYTLTQYEKDEYIKLMGEANLKAQADLEYIAMMTEVELE